MNVKCFYPLAFPSKSLELKLKGGRGKLIYLILHKMALYRLKHEFFLFPVEWLLIKVFYKLKIKYNLFAGFDSFR